MRWSEVMFIRTVHLTFEWLSGISEVLFLFTMQLQFYAILMVGDMSVKLWRTNSYIRGKCMGSYANVLPETVQTIDLNPIGDPSLDRSLEPEAVREKLN